MYRKNRFFALALAAAAAVSLSAPDAGAQVQNGEWRAYAGDKGSRKYAPLDQINTDTIGNLRIAWRQSGMPEELRALFPNVDAPTNFQNTPLMVNGRLYMSTAVGRVAALDASTGRVLWVDSPAQAEGEPPERGGSARGVAYWTDGTDERIITLMGQNLVALNARTGARYPDFGEGGRVDMTRGYDREVTGYRWRSAPMVVRDVIVMGGVPSPATDVLFERQLAPKEMPPDDIRGYDVRTGALLWTFHVVPRPGEFGNATWEDDSWAYSGNSGVWSLISADEELGYIYLPFETATGDYYGGTRPGNNLFAESLICLDVRTGERVWHYQVIHHGLWDYDLPAAPILVDIEVDGRPIKAVVQVSKQAYAYVFDRVTGEPVWPIEERPVPRGEVPGEWYAPTQPVPTKPPPFDQQGVADSDLIDFTPELKAEARAIVDQFNFGPLYTPPEVLGSAKGKGGTILLPGTNGGANWGGAGFDPESNILYVPSSHLPTIVGLVPSEHPESTLPWVKKGGIQLEGPRGLPDPFKPPYSRLVAIDLNKGDILWSVANGDGLRHHPAFAGLDLPALGTPGRLSPLVTRSFVFLGEGSDTGVGVPAGGGGKMFRAFDKQTGAIRWEMELPAGTSGAPMTYMAGGKQYITVATGGVGSPSKLYTLALP